MAKLTPKQATFVREYLVDLNATGAARRAGYSAATAEVQGPRLLGNVRVAKAIQEAIEERSKRTQISADNVLAELARIAFLDPAKAYDQNGNLLPIHEMPEDVRRAIGGIDIYKDFTEGVEVGETKKIKFWPKNAALEALGRHLKLFTDKVEMTGRDGGPQVILTMPSNGSEKKEEEK